MPRALCSPLASKHGCRPVPQYGPGEQIRFDGTPAFLFNAWAHHSAMEKHSDRGFLEPPQEGPLFADRAAASHLLHGALANGSYHCVRFLKLSFYFRPHNCH